MTTPPTPRYALFRQVDTPAPAGRPPVRRYSLTRLHSGPGGSGRFEYLKRSHD